MKRIAQVFASAALIVLGLTISAPAAKADILQDYSLAWSGGEFTPANGAAATGTMTLDLTTMPGLTNGTNFDIYSSITALSVTVTGSSISGANDTFTRADLTDGFPVLAYSYWNTGDATATTAFNMQGDVLAGLQVASGSDFNLFFASPGPYGCDYLTLCAGHPFSSEPMVMTEFSAVGPSYSSSVPEPGTSTLLLTGLFLLGLMAAAAKKRAWLRPGHQEIA